MQRETLSFIIGFKTHVGRVREVNEDSFAIFKRKELADELDALIVVADGMGGAKSGDVASRIVAETVPETVQEFLFDQDTAKRDIKRILRDAIERANARIFARQTERKELSGMGTTCIAAALKENALTIGHAGDSRVYLLREGQLHQVTDDHSEVWQQVLAGRLTREEAARSKFRNSIIKAVGLQQNTVDPDLQTLELREGDTILLCTDGLNTEVYDPEIARILAAAPTPQDACDRLVDAALRNGGSDNVTVVVLRYGQFTPIESSTVAPDPVRLPLDDEPTTDPNPSWRAHSQRESKSSRVPVAVVPADDDTDDFIEEERPRSSRRAASDESRYAAKERDNGGSSIATVLIVLLLFLVIAEGVALFIVSTNRVIQKTAVPDKSALRHRMKQEGDVDFEDTDFIYGNPRKLYEKKDLRPDFLIVEPFDSVIVMNNKGTLLRVNDAGQMTKLPGQPVGGVAGMKNTSVGFVTFDSAGNRYQSDPKQQGVQKYDIGGTRKSQDITEGQTFHPTAIGVHRQGHLYVIDEGVLTRFEATEDKVGVSSDSNP